MREPRDHEPPRLLERILEWALPTGLSGDGTVGDLSEGYQRRAAESRTRARIWYALQTASVVAYRLVAGRGASATAGDSELLMDVRWSVRSCARHPRFALGVVLVLGTGIGSVAAVFSVVDGTVANTSWWAEPDRSVAIWPEETFSFGQLQMDADEERAYRSLGGYVELAFAARTPDGGSESVNGVLITPELFRELSAQPFVGRALSDEDGLFGSEPVVVIGEALWRRSFGGDPAILGARVELSGAPVTVVGIQRAGGNAPGGRAELWMPLIVDPRDDDYFRAQSYTLVGVLREGADLQLAHDDFMAFTQTLSSLFPTFFPDGWADGRARVTRADEAQRRRVSTPLLLLFIGTGLLLLVTALNVGNLLLGRSIGRRKELAVRSSLGASRGRVVRQLLVEGVVLAGAALALGLAVASVGGRAIADLFVEAAVVRNSGILSPSVLTFTLLVSVAAWVVLSGVSVVHFLRSHRRGLELVPDSGARVQSSLVAVQAALATLLLVSAALLVATVANLRAVPLGFEPDGVLTLELSPPADRVASIPVARELYGRLAEAAVAIPGVESAGLTGWLPLRRNAPPTPINLREAPVDPREAVRAPMHMVDPGFFDVLGVQPIEGRLLGSRDRADDRPRAIVVNETLARTLWPDGGAVGREIAIDPHAWSSWAPVVGVVPDIRSGDIAGPVQPALYVALAESPARDVTLMVRADRSVASSGALAGALRGAVRDVDALVPIRTVSTMADVVRSAYATAWVMMGLLTVLAVLATGLGALGVYAVLAHNVASNRHEIGVRIALGARPGSVVGRVVRSGLLLAGVGIAAGSVVAAASTRFLESMLFQVSALHPAAFIVPGLALAAASSVAAFVPALRAGRLPPAEILRSE